MYLLEDVLADKLPVKKLPKNKHVLKRFIEVYDDKVKDANAMRPKDKCAVAKEASKVISEELKEVWSLHFGIFVVYGKMTMEDEEDPTVMIVIRQDNIETKILKLYHDYRKFEYENHRMDRPKSDKTKNKEDSFKCDILDSPLDTSVKNCKDILKASVILDWQKIWKYLQNQLSKEQPGCLGSKDTHQQRRDNRDIHDTQQQKKAEEKSKNSVKQMFAKVKGDSTHDEGDLENNNDENYTMIEKRIKTKKIDVMGPISNTGDRLGLSSRSKAMIAAAVVKAVGINVEETNINRGSALLKAKQTRLKTAKAIKDNFICPEHVVVHWDGKLLKLKAGAKADHICVYISGANEDKVTKLLGVPEVDSGSGMQQKDVVQ